MAIKGSTLAAPQLPADTSSKITSNNAQRRQAHTKGSVERQQKELLIQRSSGRISGYNHESSMITTSKTKAKMDNFAALKSDSYEALGMRQKDPETLSK